ncbi:cysteine desulfurase [Bosea sp. BE125]|uniref:cysteine desulfurase family protein n=1 Tax=Bosea sp. BE125 TaxID=2817909 RepID=UPI0028669C27|nr:cysteine desulfurase family protein [Bosea sp. BE125]MDR6875012.1 cysteine desulfurase [Bosea sp. BE125]
MPERPIYLDYQASTPMDARALAVMASYLTESFGNPHAEENLHGQSAAHVLARARGQAARLIGADSSDIIFTSGATEANNLVISGLSEGLRARGKNHLVTVATEHKAVLQVFEALGRQGHELTILPTGGDGLLDPAALAAAIGPRTGLVSVMFANNEIGVLQPIDELGRICRDREVLFHSDAAQAVGKVPVDVGRLNVDFLSLSGHKIYGPPGIGALFIRRACRRYLKPLFIGGGQEWGIRPGTVPMALCAGLGEACEIAGLEMATERQRLLQLRDFFLSELSQAGVVYSVNGDLNRRLPGNLNVSIDGVDAEALLMCVRPRLSISSGSACTSGALSPSHVLQALGLDEIRAESSIRIGFGRHTTREEVETAAAVLIAAIKRLMSVRYTPRLAVEEHSS